MGARGFELDIPRSAWPPRRLKCQTDVRPLHRPPLPHGPIHDILGSSTPDAGHVTGDRGTAKRSHSRLVLSSTLFFSVMLFSSVFVALSAASLAFASPLESRAAPDYTVKVASASSFCLILPRKAGQTIGDSESSRGQMQSFCTSSGKTSSSQGSLPSNFAKKATYKTGKGKNGKPYVQVTGTMNSGWKQLNWNDGGGQYDSNGGAGGKGNPSGSVCSGSYPIYVEIVEPDVRRFCIRCCQDKADCPTNKDTAGCPAVIPGTY